MIQMAVLLLVGSSLAPAEQPTVAGVRAMGVFPLQLPGLQAIPAGRPKVHLWCRGTKLLGVMVPDESQPRAVASAQGRSLPSAVLLRDGRCEAEGGGVSFGFLVPMRAWIFDTAVRTAPEERITWLLHRFQGAVSDHQLKGVLVQVDISHPGLAFREEKVEAEALTEEQTSFGDEKVWLEDVARTVSLVRTEP